MHMFGARPIQPLCRWALVAAAVVVLTGCMQTPSEKYKLPPPDPNEAYPQFAAPHERARPLPSAEEQERAIRNLEYAAQRQGQISGTQLRVRGVNGD